MRRELDCILDDAGKPLSDRVIRFSACDAREERGQLRDSMNVIPNYTLGEQLFVEPQPLALPDAFDLERPIKMSDAEIAIASSHISVWEMISRSAAPYSLVLEDDVWFERGFGRILDHAWLEMQSADQSSPKFDLLYTSYAEVRHGAPKELLSKNVFRPERGLWFLSGYVLSRKGAQALLRQLPCRGPVDLWINHKFRHLDVRALRRSAINQRRDVKSANSYSVLPSLARIGVLDHSDAALFHGRPTHVPVFAFGKLGSGLSSLAMALSMLGYRCCSDFDNIPVTELKNLLTDSRDRVFDAYVNIAALETNVETITMRFPRAKYIVVGEHSSALQIALEGCDVLRLPFDPPADWRKLCEHLAVAPPTARYPSLVDRGLRVYRHKTPNNATGQAAKWLRHDPSPWIAKAAFGWNGMQNHVTKFKAPPNSVRAQFNDEFRYVDVNRWFSRNDTFPGNLALFQPENLTLQQGGGLSLVVKEQSLGVRKFSAAAISSRASFLFGRFETTLQATSTPGLVTGFFLHRNSPRQEIDIEILGNQPDRLLTNVFYNPGIEGTKYDFGYRGTPVSIALGFDASKAPHQYAIEWDECEIRWFVDGKLIHYRTVWNPTPIPHLPMTVHVNTWPTNSRKLAGPLALHALPTSARIFRITVNGHSIGKPGHRLC